MKAKVKIETEIEIQLIKMSLHIRHVGGDDGDIPEDFPLLTGSTWSASVEIDTGRIVNGWPRGRSENLYAKVCDGGVYTLYSLGGVEIATLHDYVPHGVVPGEYGDYVDLKINSEGVITNWPKNPDVSEFFEGDDE